MRHSIPCQIGIVLLPAVLAAPALAARPAAPKGASTTLAVLETTDLHSNVVGYDYFKLAPEPSIGLDRTATLIAQARAEFPNTVLLDNGDTIQGNALADYQALVNPVRCDQTLSIYKVMNALKVDGAAIGNHEFNYGLGFLGQVTGQRFKVAGVDQPKRCAGPAFPQVLANVYSVRTKQPLFAPWRIIEKRVQAQDARGRAITAVVKVGIIGFTPPAIMSWDKRWLEGKVYTTGVVEAAEKYIPEMRRKGADIVVAISHGGLDDSPYSPAMENANWYLARVPGVDAMLLGHSHQLFPNAASTAPQFNLAGVDKARGTVHGVPTVMANLWGKHLGVVQLHLRADGKRWTVEKDKTVVEARAAQAADKSFVAADLQVLALIRAEHEATIAYVKTPVGSTEFRMATYFADVGDTSAIAVVNAAQTAYVKKYVAANLPQYAKLPVLSMSAPFKSGNAGAFDYTDVAAGALALNNAADLYLYPNALYAVKVDGAGLKAWLETAARRFNTIDPKQTAPQELVDASFPSYNFDTPTSLDISYEIDLTRAPGERIVNLRLRGEPVNAQQEFIVATNNYRASGGGNFPGLDGSKTVLASPDTSRDVLIAHIRATKQLTRAEHGSVRSWRFARVATAGPVVFHSAPGMLKLAREAGLDNVSLLREDDGAGKGFALYALDLAK
ncbi:bifunctional 2',3'-cyclic-nucleotide 2'-phosphodiesterase/3'-nucleotidase [Massilia sp. Dwa41.01b]|uniref:bifunctional 2',3'-cyclic-nucleotide 2'-phosphodiesterase/3'-nucleotidase n=1 Tax=unclassified Massilia TaxID=2609279 RepID=UPI001600E973|nr:MULTISPECIES: bifunctional 2',3'-cyclic-nucleotide 2'-phosphodiesterase/3'-nucleotidase [unclassified Massilia]QNA88934.1 bifunctional 2',3'-cyclic-nucleotide 2'-phosphodiesterase/3'-nucleotidase [Massilia sp. Dwa41.01b]QNA99823.1 bifunctional 2',3'-cyclic-nucleotide 2'-phosphodiesterase/3'-nucleotidase [Massilia sp. Se16.2.3]